MPVCLSVCLSVCLPRDSGAKDLHDKDEGAAQKTEVQNLCAPRASSNGYHTLDCDGMEYTDGGKADGGTR
eukprot:COSAG05_NODE_18230_length_311_cov_1.202830_1_plen_69_part_10